MGEGMEHDQHSVDYEPVTCRLFGHRWDARPVRQEGIWRVHGCIRWCPAEQRFAGPSLDGRYWSHPSWRLNFLRSWWTWMVAGRPVDMPVIGRVGHLIADADGRGTITGWHFDTTRMHGTIGIDDLWDRLSARYPVERVARTEDRGGS